MDQLRIKRLLTDRGPDLKCERGRGTACGGAQAGVEQRQASLLVSVTIKPRTFVSVKRPIRCLVSLVFGLALL